MFEIFPIHLYPAGWKEREVSRDSGNFACARWRKEISLVALSLLGRGSVSQSFTTPQENAPSPTSTQFLGYKIVHLASKSINLLWETEVCTHTHTYAQRQLNICNSTIDMETCQLCLLESQGLLFEDDDWGLQSWDVLQLDRIGHTKLICLHNSHMMITR